MGYYDSSGYHDELVWSALWLYKATENVDYLRKAESIYRNSLANVAMRWTQSWDDKRYGAAILLVQVTSSDIYNQAVRRWLDYWTIGDAGARIEYTPGGLAWLDSWGSLRYAATTASLHFFTPIPSRIWALVIAILPGSNLATFSERTPKGAATWWDLGTILRNPHHRASHGSLGHTIENPFTNRQILYGALVGGPISADDSSYDDERTNFQGNEVALDYNAGFTGAVARMVLQMVSLQ